MQKLLAFMVPMVAILYGLAALRAARVCGDTVGKTGSWLDKAAAILLVVYGALTINNLALATVSFLGSPRMGYGPRYALVDALATGSLLLAALAWAHAALNRAGAHAVEPASTSTPSRKVELKPIGLQLVGLAVLMIVVGIFLEYLRKLHVLPR